MSYHISTFDMRLPNIARVTVFTKLVHEKLLTALQKNSIIDNIANKRSFSLRILGSLKYNEKTEEHICLKKAVYPKNGTIFDFIIRLPNDESEIAESILLDILELEVKKYNDTNSEKTTQAKFDFVKSLLRNSSIEGYTLSFPSNNTPHLFPLSRNSPSYCPLCGQKHTSENGYIL